MNRNYFILTILMLVLAFGTLVLKKGDEREQIEPLTLLHELTQPTRYVTTDQVAKMLISDDPTLEIIDVRSAEEYQQYSLPKAINVPLDSLTKNDNLMYLGIPGTKVVFVSNDDIKADQFWVLAKRLGYNSIYVMKGGLNKWMETIIDPQAPVADAPHADFETYSFRKGAQLFFTGATSPKVDTPKTKVKIRRRKKSSVAAGGC